MIIFLQIILGVINVAMAEFHASLIKKGKTIKHGLWAAAYFAVVGILVWVTHLWWLIPLSMLIRKVVFDISLNIFRFGIDKIFYVTPEVKNVTGFWDAIRKGKTIDWIHYKLFGFRSWIYLSIYLVAIIVINILV